MCIRDRPCTVVRKARVEGCGTVEVFLALEHGRIAQLSFKGDFFSAEEPEALEILLVGRRPERDEFADALKDVPISRYFNGMDHNKFLDLLCGTEAVL